MKTVDIIIPAYNEEDCLEELGQRLQELFKRQPLYDFHVLLIDNASTDSTFEKAKALNDKDSRFHVIQLSRNFRMDGGLTAGLAYAHADAVVLMAADLQDPPGLIDTFLNEWEKGGENIYGVVQKRHGTSWLRRFNSKLFYKIVGFLSHGLIPENASDFRLLDRKAYETLRLMAERARFIRGLVAWTGFQSVAVEFERPERFGGVSNAHTLKVLELAIKGILANTYRPLRWITIVAGLLFCVSFIQWIYALLASELSLLAWGHVMTSMVLCAVGVIGEYIAMIYEETKQRPNFIVSQTLGERFQPLSTF
jgi:glycosyltransferase involved in cell wall biosynthesis